MTGRVGQGFDAHAFSDDPHRPLMLGGVHIEGGPGLAGHSDADVLVHALADALLGAAGLGDLGELFPSEDPTWADADSLDLLAEVLRRVGDAGYRPCNADCTVVAHTPRLSPHRGAMVERLTSALGAPVSVKATSTDGLGAVGRGEGVAALAVVLLDSIDGPGS
jgi:2-C-methyl-D-erythritol 2,4-cyclodiphosphate synthase